MISFESLDRTSEAQFLLLTSEYLYYAIYRPYLMFSWVLIEKSSISVLTQMRVYFIRE
jgi:hypothetical protein